MEIKRLYVAGPMSGYENLNKPAFAKAAKYWRTLGFSVFNPGENEGGDEQFSREHYMRLDLQALVCCDCAAFLIGWENSLGAKLEMEIVRQLGMFFWTQRGDGTWDCGIVQRKGD